MSQPHLWLWEGKNKWLKFQIHAWKGIKKGGMRPHTVTVDYNPLSAMFCPLRCAIASRLHSALCEQYAPAPASAFPCCKSSTLPYSSYNLFAPAGPTSR